MARIDDIPQPTRDQVVALEIPTPAERPFVTGSPLRERRIAMVTSAALHDKRELPFLHGTTEFRELPSSLPATDIRMSHVSINFDRAGFQRDHNVAYPIDRLREFAAEGRIGSLAETHYSVMGSTDPATMSETVEALSARLRRDRVDGVLFLPV
jgi:D-proline reductase (dithiol) PrdB